MIFRRWVAALFCLVAACTPAAVALATPALAPAGHAAPVATERMDDFVQAQMQATGVPGVAYAIVGLSGVLHTGVFGTDGNGQTVTPATPFLWGSLAKPVAATLAMTLVAAGELELDAPVTTYLAAFRLRDAGQSRRITIRHLLNQSSGIPTSVELTDRFNTDRRPADVLSALAEVAMVSAPGVEHHYSSTNYLVLAAVIEAVTGQPFADVLTQRVLDPLGMATMITTPSQAERRLPPGHRFVFGQAVAFATSFDPAGVGYGYLGGTLADAVAFAQANLGGANVLSQAQRATMFQGDVTTSGDHRYGLGWRRWPLQELVAASGDDMVWHGGAAPGYQALIILLPGQERAVVVLQNGYGFFQEPRLLDTGFGLVRLLSGEAPSPSGAGMAYSATLAALSAGCLLLMWLTGRSIRRLTHPRRQQQKRARV